MLQMRGKCTPTMILSHFLDLSWQVFSKLNLGRMPSVDELTNLLTGAISGQ